MARVAIDAGSTSGRPTGIGRYTAGLLAALVRSESEHEYLPLRPRREVVMRTDRRLRWQQWELPRAARSAGADLLHVTGFDPPLRSRVPVVVTVHDLVGVIRPADHPPVSRWYWGRWLPLTVRAADVVIVVSESTRLEVSRLAGVPDDAIVVVPPGIDASFHPAAAAVVAQTADRYDLCRPYVLYVGTTEPRKGIDTLLAAFAGVASAVPHDLVIVGLRTRPLPAVGGALRHRVRELGYVPDADLPALYSGADVVVLPSRHEGFGLPVVEAMACGTPVVCTTAGALGEAAAGAALQVPVDDASALAEALVGVVTDESVAASLRRKGFERAAELDWDRAAARTVEAYATALAGGRRRGSVLCALRSTSHRH